MNRALWMTLVSIALCAGAFTGGCQSNKAMRMAARAAGEEVGALEFEIRQKIRVENEYYQRAIEYTVADIRRGREDALLELFQRESEEFMQRHGRSSADRLADQLASHMNDFVRNWESAEQQRRSTIRRTVDQLEKSRRALQYEGAKLRQLRSRLLALGERRSSREQMRFIVSYSLEVRDALEVLREESAAAP